MQWIIFSYSLPSQARSSPRVMVWRRLRRFGALSLAGGIYILPTRDECLEAFQWLAQEVRQAEGQALMIHVQSFDGLTDQAVIALFRQARQADYSQIAGQATELQNQITNDVSEETLQHLRDSLAKLQRHHNEVRRIDYFDCPEGISVAAQLADLAQALTRTQRTVEPGFGSASLASYKQARWVTRPRPHVDRLACIWLIRRFINLDAVIRYGLVPEPGEVSFDMDQADFGHTGSYCTFETMLRTFNLTTPGLAGLAEIVHEIDLRDEQYTHPEVSGIETILTGWLLLNLSDTELEQRGLALFEGLYQALTARFKAT